MDFLLDLDVEKCAIVLGRVLLPYGFLLDLDFTWSISFDQQVLLPYGFLLDLDKESI